MAALGKIDARIQLVIGGHVSSLADVEIPLELSPATVAGRRMERSSGSSLGIELSVQMPKLEHEISNALRQLADRLSDPTLPEPDMLREQRVDVIACAMYSAARSSTGATWETASEQTRALWRAKSRLIMDRLRL